jgi:hypothetical protein
MTQYGPIAGEPRGRVLGKDGAQQTKQLLHLLTGHRSPIKPISSNSLAQRVCWKHRPRASHHRSPKGYCGCMRPALAEPILAAYHGRHTRWPARSRRKRRGRKRWKTSRPHQ